MLRVTTAVIFAGILATIVTPSKLYAKITCPDPPQTVGSDVVVNTRAQIHTLGRIGTGEFQNETRRTVTNLVQSMPGGDRVMLANLLISVGCQVIRDSTTLTDDEKLNRVRQLNEQVIVLIHPQRTSREPADFAVRREDPDGIRFFISNGVFATNLEVDVVAFHDFWLMSEASCRQEVPIALRAQIALSHQVSWLSAGFIISRILVNERSVEEIYRTILSRASRELCQIELRVRVFMEIKYDDEAGVNRRTYMLYSTEYRPSRHPTQLTALRTRQELFAINPGEFRDEKEHFRRIYGNAKLRCYDTSDCADAVVRFFRETR
jgi:hypothetical protein